MSKERIYCNTCKAQTWHEQAASYSHDRLDQLMGFSQQIDSWIFICCGCDDVSFRLVRHPFEFQNEEDEPEELVYPDRGFKFRDRKYFSGLPKNIERLYRETITTYDLGLLVLSTVGVRGLIEAIVADKIPGENYKDNLNSKIQALSPHFPTSVIDTLHEFRRMGNKAAHELEAPESLNIHHALYVIEGIIGYFYAVEEHAALFTRYRKN
ncbi:DUF4145 domain-containing protein [Halomonas sp. MC140]|nr:DUF4145 domain-containing protein [Halomonas sp. MC140]MDN7131330.1 DUF4145 domain-containing protein [Halomonas sp. MC140]